MVMESSGDRPHPLAPVADEPMHMEMGSECGREGVDVTELCRQAAAILGPNEMIHDPDFSLYGAMSALELMDAKMDKAPPALEVRMIPLSGVDAWYP